MAEKELSVIELTEENIESIVYEIRGQKVMLDVDLARIYGYETKNFNRQVKNNIEKFPEDFMFQLTMDEVKQLSRCQIGTTKNSVAESEEFERSQFVTPEKSVAESEDLVMSQIVTSRNDSIESEENSWSQNATLKNNSMESEKTLWSKKSTLNKPDNLRSKNLTAKNSGVESEEIVRCKNCTPEKIPAESEKIERSKKSTPELWAAGKGGRSYLPYAFTEQGIYMLMTVLKGELAVKQSKALIRLFKGMKDYIGEIASNPYNSIVNNKRFAIQREFERIVENEDRIGYLVINNFRVSKEISEKLGVDNKMALLMSKGKLISISKDHGITGEQFADVIKKATYSPEAIVYDRERHSFQFYAKLDEDSYRTVIEFGAIPKGMKNVKADILTTLFKNQYYEKRIESIKDHKFPELILRYEKRSGWALIATDSSNQNIPNDKNDVKE